MRTKKPSLMELMAILTSIGEEAYLPMPAEAGIRRSGSGRSPGTRAKRQWKIRRQHGKGGAR